MPTTKKTKSKGGTVSMFPKKPADVVKMIKDNDVLIVDLVKYKGMAVN